MNVALLRAVNVAGHQPVSMAELRAFFEDLKFTHVKTLLNSGNIVFDGTATEEMLEREAEKRLGLATDFIVRNASEWQKIVERNPFAREAKDDPARLVVFPMKAAAKEFDWPGPEIVRVDGTNAYIYYPEGQGRSKLTTAVLDKRLGTRGTARNWNTAMKIAAALTAR